MKIVLATSNAHKVKEFNELAKGYDLEFISLKDINFEGEIIENGITFKENSLIKAKTISKFTNLPVLADDSGIIIEDLGDNFPGVYSHRFQIQNGGSYQTNLKLVKEVPGSRAYFTCALTLILEDKIPHEFEGKYYGKIANKVVSENGFGYDPIFIPEGYRKTVHELSDEEKNKISHRSLAFDKLLKFLNKNCL